CKIPKPDISMGGSTKSRSCHQTKRDLASSIWRRGCDIRVREPDRSRRSPSSFESPSESHVLLCYTNGTLTQVPRLHLIESRRQQKSTTDNVSVGGIDEIGIFL